MADKLPVVIKKGQSANLPSTGNINVLYFAEDTGVLYKASMDGGNLIPYSGIVGTYESVDDLDLTTRLENKIYIVKGKDKEDNVTYELYIFTKELGFIPVSSKGGDSDVKINQKTKLNVVATPENPYILTIPIDYTADFKKLPIEVLRMEGEDQENITDIIATFDNSEIGDFQPNEYVIMDGTMRIRKDWEIECDTIDEDKGIYSFDMSQLNKFKVLESFEIV